MPTTSMTTSMTTSARETTDRDPSTTVARADLALAEDYERRTTLFPGWRERLVALLAPRPGDTVIDVGCGSGLNFAALRARVGVRGRIIGIDPSPRLLAVAAQRVALRRWDNVELINMDLINSPVGSATLPQADAALFAAGHDVLQSSAAVDTVLGHLRPGAAVAAGGWKWPCSRWCWPLRHAVALLAGPYITDFVGFDRPWRLLAARVAQLQLTEVVFGAGYLARAHLPHHPAIT